MKNVKKKILRVVESQDPNVYESIRRVAISKEVFMASDCVVKKWIPKEDDFSKVKFILEGLVVENILSKVGGGYTFHSNVERAYFMTT